MGTRLLMTGQWPFSIPEQSEGVHEWMTECYGCAMRKQWLSAEQSCADVVQGK